MRGLRGMVWAAVGQLVIGLIVTNPWAVPDLLLGSLVVASTAPGPFARLTPALVGGALAMMMAGREPLLAGLSYAGAGGVVAVAATRWDLSERSAQAVAVTMLETGLIAVWLIADQTLSGRLLLWGLGKTVLTLACLPWVRTLVGASPHG